MFCKDWLDFPGMPRVTSTFQISKSLKLHYLHVWCIKKLGSSWLCFLLDFFQKTTLWSSIQYLNVHDFSCMMAEDTKVAVLPYTVKFFPCTVTPGPGQRWIKPSDCIMSLTTIRLNGHNMLCHFTWREVNFYVFFFLNIGLFLMACW